MEEQEKVETQEQVQEPVSEPVKEKAAKSVKESFKEHEKGHLNVRVTSEKLYRRNVLTRSVMLISVGSILLLSILYGILYIINNTGNFTINLDPNLQANKNIFVSNSSDFGDTGLKFTADRLDYMDNISVKWLPDDLDKYEGPHNGNNYIAYTFFIKNRGSETTNYAASIDVVSVINNVDEAIRVRVYQNGVYTDYAKMGKSGEPEKNTTPFVNDEQVMRISRKEFAPDQVDRYTVVIWLEGDDPECTNSILGGEMKMVMNIGEDK